MWENNGMAQALTTEPTSSQSQGAAAVRPARSLLVDVVRGLAISLVVLGHQAQGVSRRGWWGPGPFGNNLWVYIYEFHMPAFFFVSGIFIASSVAKRGPARFVKTKLSQMMYPYLLWSVLIYLVNFPLQRFMHVQNASPSKFLLELLDGDTLWFMPAIFFCVTLGMLFRNVNKPALFALASAAALLPVHWHPTFLARTLEHFPYLVAGMWVSREYERIERISLPVAAVGTAVLAGVVYFFSSLTWPHKPYAELIAGLVGTAMLFLLARCLQKGSLARALAWAGEASLGIYLMSAYGQGIGREMLLRGLHTTEPVVHLLFPALLGVAIPAWIYQYRVRLKLDWLFVWPFKSPAEAA